MPEPGFEVRDGEFVVDLAWPDVKVAVIATAHPEAEAALWEDGWTVLPPDLDRIVAALGGTGDVR
ncbi:hypothetical protein ACOBQX_26150 [Actinokineospora sp. G85]|uniref:hypothetical protein n=1 Tax=Actinokineospora sp. G85 TaxID=3406626 RepID=UPI003C76656E